MDRYQLSREFEMVLQCERIRRTDDIEALQRLAINLVRMNRGLRESLSAVVKEEIPEIKLPEIGQ